MSCRLYLRAVCGPEHPEGQMLAAGVCREGIDIMLPKMRYLSFMVRGLDPRGANILKQELLAAGAEAAIPYHALADMDRPADCLVSGTERQLAISLEKLKLQPFGLKGLAGQMEEALANLRTGRAGTGIMGILNVTPDSFSDGGQYLDVDSAVRHALEMEAAGADIIDIGGESTRPGAGRVSPGEQLARVIPVIEALAGRLKVPMSIDSREPGVIARALDAGASTANLVGGIRSGEMLDVLGSRDCQVILMHMQGEPDTMQTCPRYDDVMDDIVDWARDQIVLAGEAGIGRERLLIDPGIGFGKTVEHNLEILRRLGELRILGCRVLVGASRKSFIGHVLGLDVDQRLEGSIAAAVVAAMNGADMVRVHDVVETARALALADSIRLSAYGAGENSGADKSEKSIK